MPHLDLKIAVIKSGRTQRVVSALSGIKEPRLSTIINGWARASIEERLALQRILNVGPEAFEPRATTEAGSEP